MGHFLDELVSSVVLNKLFGSVLENGRSEFLQAEMVFRLVVDRVIRTGLPIDNVVMVHEDGSEETSPVS